jgi:uncharacterized protein (UPF0303 family)
MTNPVPYTPASLDDQAASLRLSAFTVGDAVALGSLAVTRAGEQGLGIVIMVRHTGRTVFQAAMPGSVADSDEWVVRKARTVERFGLATLAQFVRAEERGRDFHETYSRHTGAGYRSKFRPWVWSAAFMHRDCRISRTTTFSSRC